MSVSKTIPKLTRALHRLTRCRGSFNEDFVCNFHGYLSLGTIAGSAPNLLQMLRLLDVANVSSVAPLPVYPLSSRIGAVHAIGTIFHVVFPCRVGQVGSLKRWKRYLRCRH